MKNLKLSEVFQEHVLAAAEGLVKEYGMTQHQALWECVSGYLVSDEMLEDIKQSNDPLEVGCLLADQILKFPEENI